MADGMLVRFIIDAYTNKEIIGSIKHLFRIDNQTIAQEEKIEEQKFQDKKRKLFNER